MSALPNPSAKPEVAFVPVDPATAKRWLGRNYSNRGLRDAKVASFARDMAGGNWQMTGEGIKFSPEGKLLDGQHRLHAIVKANTTVMMLVIRNVSESAQSVMDTGTARTASDGLGFRGHQHTSTLAATGRLALQVERGDWGNNFAPTHSEIYEWIDANPGIVRSAELSRSWSRNTDCPRSMVAYTHFRLAKIDVFDAANFWNAASEKIGLREGDPVIAMTNRFAEARRNRQPLTRSEFLSGIYRAWNYRRDGKPLRILKINSAKGGMIPIPEPK
ncbi:hypothetical protein [Nocardioides sp.]|uniref:hypothetical protein n=1 Tax=Nocardioides sp. TaxID=35761 RepID=UPI0035188B8A